MNIYESIATRTNGNIYVGVVGPVRTGKSTFITKFMEKIVLPNMENNSAFQRMLDELPQSGSGKLIMTMEPRFVPSEPVAVSLSKTKASVRLVDCVGYLVDGATGNLTEEGLPRLVKTPWADEPISFDKASEIGTSRVITDHCTVGVVVTTDGTITDIDRQNYVAAEERTINELKALGKPFVVVLNTISPGADSTIKLARAMEDKYSVKVLVKDINEMTAEDFAECFELLLYEFPVNKISFELPDWMMALPEDDNLIQNIVSSVSKCEICKMSEYVDYESIFSSVNGVLSPALKELNLGVGEIKFEIPVTSELFYQTISNITGQSISSDWNLMDYIKSAAVAKNNYEKLESALQRSYETGYGVVMPSVNDLELSEPRVLKKAGESGLKLSAKAPSLHIMRVDVETEVQPTMGTGLLAENINAEGEYTGDSNEIWNTSVFGRTLVDIAHEGIVSKLNSFPEEAELKMRKTLTKITNEGKGGIICILL